LVFYNAPVISHQQRIILKCRLGLVSNLKANMQYSVGNELLCSKKIAVFGLLVAHCDMIQFEGQKVLVVERFYRKFASDPG